MFYLKKQNRYGTLETLPMTSKKAAIKALNSHKGYAYVIQTGQNMPIAIKLK